MGEMHNEVRTAWVEALRSEKFEQASGAFVDRFTDGGKEHVQHCCLAVLTEVAIDQGCPGIRRRKPKGNDFAPFEVDVAEPGHEPDWYLYDGGELPAQVAAWAGVLDDDSVSDFRDQNEGGRLSSSAAVDLLIGGVSAVSLNDSLGRTFDEIADAIEESPVTAA